MKNKKIFGIPMLALVLGILVVGGATAVLLANFGVLRVNMTTSQAVLVDGMNRDELTAVDVSIVANDNYCSVHELLNQANIEVELELTELNTYTGIDVSYNTLLNEWQFTQDETSNTAMNFNVNVINAENGDLLISVLDNANISTSKIAGTVTVFYENGDAKYLVGYNTERTGEIDTVYKEYDSGFGAAQEAPNHFVLTKTNDEWTLTIPTNKIETTDKLAFNIELIGAGSAQQARYPTNWGWQGNFPDAVNRVVSESLVNPFTLQPGETLNFERCYDTDLLLASGSYTLGTIVDVV